MFPIFVLFIPKLWGITFLMESKNIPNNFWRADMKSYTQILTSSAVVLLLNGCTPQIYTHGNIPDPESLAQIKPNTTTQQDVLRLLGSPSHRGGFKEMYWAYASQKTSTTSFFAPDVLETKVLIVSFNQAGTVEKTTPMIFTDLPPVDYVSDATRIAGHDETMFQKMFGNFGKYGVLARDSKKAE